LVRLMASGIYQFWKYWLRDRKYIESKLRTESTALPDPLTLRSNVAFVFVIPIIGLSASVAALCMEFLFRAFEKCDFKTHLNSMHCRLRLLHGALVQILIQIRCRQYVFTCVPRLSILLTSLFNRYRNQQPRNNQVEDVISTLTDPSCDRISASIVDID